MALPAFMQPKLVTPDTSTSAAPVGHGRDAVLHTYKRGPLEMARGEGVFLIDTDGNRYLDFVSGIAVNALGYGDAGLVSAMREAADGLTHVSNLYWTAPAARLASALVARSF